MSEERFLWHRLEVVRLMPEGAYKDALRAAISASLAALLPVGLQPAPGDRDYNPSAACSRSRQAATQDGRVRRGGALGVRHRGPPDRASGEAPGRRSRRFG